MQVVPGPEGHQTMEPMSIVCLPTNNTQLIGPPEYTNYPASK